MLRYFAVVALLQGLPQQSELPAPVEAGLRDLTAGRCAEAFTGWSQNWTGTDDVGKQQSLRAGCDVLGRLGTLHGYDVLRIIDVGPHVRRVYLVLRYELQPVYLMLVAYRPAAEWKVNTVNWNTLSDKVLPAAVAPAERPQQ